MAGQSLLHQKGQLIQEFGTVKQIVRTGESHVRTLAEHLVVAPLVQG